MPLIEISFQGKLADEFGDSFRFDVSTIFQALSALSGQLPGFARRFREGKYDIFRKRNGTKYPAETPDDWRFRLTENDSVIVAPKIAGSAAGAFVLFTFAFSYVVGKVFTPQIQPLDYPTGAPTKPSFLFDGPTNITAQGVCVPVVYGQVRAGSVVVSESVNSILVPPEAVDGDKIFAIWKGTVDTRRIVDVISEGETEGLVDGDASIYLNETPLRGAVTTYVSSNIEVAAGNIYRLPAGHGQSYAADQVIGVSGFINAENNGLKTIADIDGNDVIVQETLVAESAGPSVTITGYVYNFENVVWAERVGSAIQDHIIGFPQTEQTIPVGADVEPGSPVVRTVTGADLDALLVTMKFPQGLYRIPDWGGYAVMWVRIRIEIKPFGGSYELAIDSQVWGQVSAPLKIDYRLELPSGVSSWDVRVSKTEWVPSEASFWQDDLEWDAYTTIIDAKLSYPDTALYSLALNAQDFAGRTPNRAYEVRGVKLAIPSNYDPITREYTGIWDGTFQTAWSDNPAWVLYDLLASKRYGLGNFIDAAQIDKFELYSIAQFCDERVSSGFGIVSDDIEVLAGDIYELPTGHEQMYDTDDVILVQGFTEAANNGLKTVTNFSGDQITVSETLVIEAAGDTVSINHTEPRYVFNGVLGKRDDAYKTLSAVVSNFRGSIFWGSNGEVGFSQERDDKAPVKLVTPANVIDGLFTYSGAQLSERHSVALVSWNDPTDNYKTAVEVVEDEELIAELGWKPIDVAAFACTSRGQAYRYGKYALVTERYESERVTYKASFDHADLRPGDIIEIADGAYAGVRFGGRIAARTLSAVTIDAAIELEVGESYEMSVILDDGTIETRDITNAPGAGQTVMNLSAPLTSLPVLGSLWIINATNVEAREFTVVSVRETEKNVFEIGAVFRLPNKFAVIENDYQIETDNYSIFDFDESELPVVTGLSAREYTYRDGGAILSGARISWNAPVDPAQAGRVAFYDFQYREPDADGFIPGVTTTELEAEVLNIQEGNYKVRVRVLSAAGAAGAWTTAEFDLLGAKAPPSDVENFGIQTAGATSLLTWNPVPELDLSHYVLRYSVATSGATWSSAVAAANDIVGTQISLPARVGTYLIKAVDVYGVESVNAALVVSSIAGLLSFNVVETFTESPNFPGTFDDTFVFDEILQLGDGRYMSDWTTLAEVETLAGLIVVPEGFYYFSTNPFDLGAVYSSRITAEFEADGWNKVSLTVVADGWSVTLQLRTTEDDPAGSPIWSGWRDFVVGDYTARGLEFRIRLNSYAANVTPRVTFLQVIVDMPDRIVGDSDVTCPVAGLQVDYDPPFQTRPALAIDSQDMDTGDYKTVTGQDETGFFVRFFDSGDTAVERTFDYIAKGYGGL
jgi:predicted phage tail protein